MGMHNGVLPHFFLAVHAFLNVFLEQWLGQYRPKARLLAPLI